MNTDITAKEEYTVIQIAKAMPKMRICCIGSQLLIMSVLVGFWVLEHYHKMPDYPFKFVYIKALTLSCFLMLAVIVSVTTVMGGTRLFMIFDKHPKMSINAQTMSLMLDMVCGSQGMFGRDCKKTALQYVPDLLANIKTYEFLQIPEDKRKKLYKELRSDNSVLIKSILNLLDRCNDPLAIPELELFTASNSRKVNNPEIVSHAQSCLKMIESA